MLKIMIRNNLQMISPGIVNASMTSTTPYKLSPASTIRRFKPRYTLGHYAEVRYTSRIPSHGIIRSLKSLQLFSHSMPGIVGGK